MNIRDRGTREARGTGGQGTFPAFPVRRLADNLSRYHLVGERERALLREASAAIGDGQP